MSDNANLVVRNNFFWKYSLMLVLTSIIVLGAFIFLKDNNQGKIIVDVDDDPFLGDINAPVVIIEFSDYQCPFCRKFWTETFGQLKKDYIDTGKVKFVYRDFSLTSIHPSSEFAAQAANCVREQGGDTAYFEMHDKIFQEQNILGGGDPYEGPVRGVVQFDKSDLKKWANEIGYDIESCLNSEKYLDEIKKDLKDAQNAGGKGTPYFIINDKPLVGAQPYSEFQKIIEEELLLNGF